MRNPIRFIVIVPILSVYSFCPQIDVPCTCTSSAFEPVNIKCSGSSLVEILKILKSAKNVLKMDSLLINSTLINVLPPNAFQGLNIVRISLRKTGLTDFDPLAFDGHLLDSVLELDLTDNNFTRVPFNGVQALKNLRKLNLSKNQIANLQPDAFSAYESKDRLRSLDLSSNKIGILDPAAIAQLKNLEEISLQGNLLVEIPTVALKHVKYTLKNLNLALNRITYIEPFTFDLPKLESLSLEYNDLTDIAPEALHGLPALRYLYLTGNKLIRWESELYRSVTNLRNLGIGGTAITHIPWNAFTHLPNLLRLEMSDGIVNTLDNRAFKGARYLQAIILNNNQLTEVKEDTFQGLTDLYTLDLSRNSIQHIADGAFAFLPALRHLDLCGNELQSLESHTFENTFVASSDAKMLYLCRNPWVCNEKMDVFRRWLRDNMEIVIDKPDCTAVCKEPDWLTNWPVRFPNPPPPAMFHFRHLQHRPEVTADTTPFYPPYVITTSQNPDQFENTTANTSIPFYARLHRNPPNGVQYIDGKQFTDSAIPTFAQIFLGRMSGSMRDVLHMAANVQPGSRKDHDYRYAKSIFGKSLRNAN